MNPAYRKLAFGLYGLALAASTAALLDLVSTAWPLRFGAVAWRFGVQGIAFSSLSTLLGGFAIAFVTATLFNHGRVIRSLSILCFALSALILLGMGAFTLDFQQLRQAANPQGRPAFDRASIKALVIAALYFPTLVALGIGGWRATRGERSLRGKSASRIDAADLVVGRPQT